MKALNEVFNYVFYIWSSRHRRSTPTRMCNKTKNLIFAQTSGASVSWVRLSYGTSAQNCKTIFLHASVCTWLLSSFKLESAPVFYSACTALQVPRAAVVLRAGLISCSSHAKSSSSRNSSTRSTTNCANLRAVVESAPVGWHTWKWSSHGAV